MMKFVFNTFSFFFSFGSSDHPPWLFGSVSCALEAKALTISLPSLHRHVNFRTLAGQIYWLSHPLPIPGANPFVLFLFTELGLYTNTGGSLDTHIEQVARETLLCSPSATLWKQGCWFNPFVWCPWARPLMPTKIVCLNSIWSHTASSFPCFDFHGDEHNLSVVPNTTGQTLIMLLLYICPDPQLVMICTTTMLISCVYMMALMWR